MDTNKLKEMFSDAIYVDKNPQDYHPKDVREARIICNTIAKIILALNDDKL